MRQKKVLLASLVVAGSCFGIAPAWTQTSTNPTTKTPQTTPGDKPVADKEFGHQGSGQSQSSRESSKMNGRMPDVKKIQEALKDKGNDPGALDGRMGPKTREALKSFQTANKLKATGMMDAETAKQLGVDASLAK
jgi:peptidoglycan hydrolase-like protein with peptidoglycan-binding domain